MDNSFYLFSFLSGQNDYWCFKKFSLEEIPENDVQATFLRSRILWCDVLLGNDNDFAFGKGNIVERKRRTTEEVKAEFLRYWLVGTTCAREAKLEIIWTSDDGRFIVAKHFGHTTHLVRSDYGYCETYYELHDLAAGTYHPYPSRISGTYFALKVWEKGRWSKKRQKEAEEIVENGKNKI